MESVHMLYCRSNFGYLCIQMDEGKERVHSFYLIPKRFYNPEKVENRLSTKYNLNTVL